MDSWLVIEGKGKGLGSEASRGSEELVLYYGTEEQFQYPSRKMWSGWLREEKVRSACDTGVERSAGIPFPRSLLSVLAIR